jgi:hypothetical protein
MFGFAPPGSSSDASGAGRSCGFAAGDDRRFKEAEWDDTFPRRAVRRGFGVYSKQPRCIDVQNRLPFDFVPSSHFPIYQLLCQ